MRLVFMGTPQIAKVCLQKIYEAGHEIVGVYTKPDTPKNRGMKMAMSEVKEYAISVGLPVYQPATFRDETVVSTLRDLQPEMIVVVAYGKILPQSVLDIPALGCVNMHASILPELRGAGPVQWSILNHLQETGITAMYMSAGMDEGDIIEIRKTAIDANETSEELMERLSHIAAELACDTIKNIEGGTASRIPQDNSRATYAPMLSKELSPIRWNQPLQHVIDQVRGLIPWPVATMDLEGKRFKVYRIEDAGKTSECTPGTILGQTKKGLEVVCGDGRVGVITQLQAEGGKRMSAADYFRGHPLQIH